MPGRQLLDGERNDGAERADDGEPKQRESTEAA